MIHHRHLSRFLCGALLWVSVLVLLQFFFVPNTEAANIHNYSDLLSTSAPATTSNHTVEFRNTEAIPASGSITVTPEDGFFDIPAATFSERNVEVYVSIGGGAYTLRPATTTPDATNDGISITSGTSGNVTVTLNSSTGIPADADIRILLGKHTTNATGTDTGIWNPAATGTREINIAYGGGTPGSARALVAIVDQVGFGPIDTTETDPPIRFNGAPMGELSSAVTSAEVSLETNEFAVCRYDTASGTPYSSMLLQFNSTSSLFHSFIATGLLNETTYTYYVRCIDDEANFNTDDYVISFSIPEVPDGEPGGGDDTTGDDTGTGDGSSGTGSGDTSGNTSGSGGGGGGGGGGEGGGGVDTSDRPYESGDGRVIINGFSFPNARVTVLVDGVIAENKNADNQGDFSVTIDEIARGVYTFGVYATDPNNVRSSTFTTTFTVTGSRGSTLSNVNLMPTIRITPDTVEPGETVTFSGFGIADSTIFIETQQDVSGSAVTSLTTTSAANGSWSVDQNTAGFARDTWKVRGRSSQVSGSVSTGWSQYFFYGVGVEVSTEFDPDLNRDGRVNLIDFSILLFHWGTSGGSSDPPADINHDGTVSLTDFSIMIFNWTG